MLFTEHIRQESALPYLFVRKPASLQGNRLRIITISIAALLVVLVAVIGLAPGDFKLLALLPLITIFALIINYKPGFYFRQFEVLTDLRDLKSRVRLAEKTGTLTEEDEVFIYTRLHSLSKSPLSGEIALNVATSCIEYLENKNPQSKLIEDEQRKVLEG